jgi:hypothetical protein
VETIVSVGGLPAANPERPSVQAKLTVTFVLFQPNEFAAGVRLPVILGPVLSMLIPVLVTGSLTFPATSVQVPGPADCPAPSVVNVIAAVQVAMPDKPSVPLKVTVTFVLFQPAAFGAGDCAADAVGAVLSILMPVRLTGSLTFPALSVQVPGPADRAAPSEVKTTGAEQVSIPDSPSVPLKLTVTSVLFQPAAFAAGA